MVSQKKRVLLGATWSAIENLGIMHVGGLARSLGWEVFYCQPKNHDFAEFLERVDDIKPDVVGYNVYTGAHTQLKRGLLEPLRRKNPSTRIVIGGPHATYFPQELATHADNVVMSEGFSAFRKILNDEVGGGIIEFLDENMEKFPLADREGYYRDSPFHRNSLIKSIIGMSGCPYNCTYCNNSDTGAAVIVPDNMRATDERIRRSLAIINGDGESCHEHEHTHSKTRRKGSRAFPRNVREPEDIIAEALEVLRLSPETKMFYHQDDVWLQQSERGQLHYRLAHEWREKIPVASHGQMRWEMLRGESGDRRLDLAQLMGATGLTLAIESADGVIREEVLSRKMPQEIMYDGTAKLAQRGMTLRTEQITALPAGATAQETSINLELDLKTLELNVDLRKKFGLPTISWSSTLAPYAGTGIGLYMAEHGFYDGDNTDVPDEFFDRSVARFVRRWVGPQLKDLKDDPSVWLPEDELNQYRNRNAELRNHWNTFALTPDGHVLAKSYLESSEPFSYARLGKETEAHLTRVAQQGDERAAEILKTIDGIRAAQFLDLNGQAGDNKIREDVHALAPYFAILPQPTGSIEYAIKYAHDTYYKQKAAARGESQAGISPHALTTAIRRSLYDLTLYKVQDEERRVVIPERYPPKF